MPLKDKEKKIDMPFTNILILGALITITVIFHMWWYANAPYCCTHMCGATHGMWECWGEIVGDLLIILTVCYLASWIIEVIR